MYQIIWTRTALLGYAAILTYLDHHWTEREVKNFEKEITSFLELLRQHPKMLQVSRNVKIRRGPINKQTVLTYQVKPRKKEIHLLSLRSSRQGPVQ